jgi:signal transduction histidine kinase
MLRRGLLAACANTAIALALTAWGESGFGQNFVFSQLIGLCIWALIDFGQLWLVQDWDRQWWRVVLLVPLGVVVGYALGSLLGARLLGHDLLQHWTSAPRDTIGLLLMSLLAGAVGTYFFMSRERLASARQRELAAQRQAAEAQLKLLQTQLEPHMLFNTLANLRVLVASDPPRAQAMIDRLVAFLRSTLDASRATQHALGQEFERLRDYLELMQVRMGPRLRFSLEIPASLSMHQVPPLLLQALVENAIKHGLEPKLDGGSVSVRARLDSGMVVIDVCDTGAGLAHPAAAPGFGLAQVRERLSSAYGASASFDMRGNPDGSGGVTSTVRFPAALHGTAP